MKATSCHPKLAGSRISANCSPLPRSTEISLKKQQSTQSLGNQVNKPKVCSRIKAGLLCQGTEGGETAGRSLRAVTAWPDGTGMCWKQLVPSCTSLPGQTSAHPDIAPHICMRLHTHEVDGN